MSPLQLALAGADDGAVATVRLSVGDSSGEVIDVEFDSVVIDVSGAETRAGPFPADRAPAFGAFEKEILLDATRQTRIEARARLASGALVAAPGSVTLGPRASDATLARALGVLNASLEYGRLAVAVTPGSASSWKSYARRNAWPTISGMPDGVLDDAYLRFESNRDELAFGMQVSGIPGDVWCVIAVGYNAAGAEGPRAIDALDYTVGSSARPAMSVVAIPTNGIEQRKVEVVESLKEFTSWLSRFGKRGYIGEVGWTWNGGDAWNQVAESWFAVADEAKLWVTAWATGESWGPNYTLQPYVSVNGAWTKKPQALVLENPLHRTTPEFARGVNVAGAEFRAPDVQARTNWFSNVNRGIAGPGADYAWNSLAIYQYLAAQGHTLARIPFRWERIQPTLGAPLDAAELQRMTDSVTAAGQAGLSVILDAHNYGAYWLHDAATGDGVRATIGTAEVTFAHFSDLWSRLAAAFNANAAVIGYGLMNEPVYMTPAPGLTPARTWETAAQGAVDAIRAAEGSGAHKWISVGGYMWSGTWSLPVKDREPFITDPASDRLLYEAHQYWDEDRTGRYLTPELDPVRDEHWVRWLPNGAMWTYQSAGGDGVEAYDVEVFRAGQLTPIATTPLWKKGHADLATFCTDPADLGCAHRTSEYRIVATNALDGSVMEYAATVSGFHK